MRCPVEEGDFYMHRDLTSRSSGWWSLYPSSNISISCIAYKELPVHSIFSIFSDVYGFWHLGPFCHGVSHMSHGQKCIWIPLGNNDNRTVIFVTIYTNKRTHTCQIKSWMLQSFILNLYFHLPPSWIQHITFFSSLKKLTLHLPQLSLFSPCLLSYQI